MMEMELEAENCTQEKLGTFTETEARYIKNFTVSIKNISILFQLKKKNVKSFTYLFRNYCIFNLFFKLKTETGFWSFHQDIA